MLKLPLDLSTFARLRKSGYLYVDKTQHIYDLITGGHRYFLSRPRRFGKSLLVSTLKEVLVGNKNLFKELWIERSDYQWDIHGVITLDLSSIRVTNTSDLTTGICSLLQDIANDYNLAISLHAEKPDIALRALVRALYAQFGRVAILVDEYDNPILQVLNDEDNAQEVRKTIRSFFTVIKSLDSFIDFVFITGVSSFSRAGLFSGINNLRIITLQKRFSGICGYTDQEIEHYFNYYIQAWSKANKITSSYLRRAIKEWYNGYHFGADVPSVYNPYSLMNALDMQEFKNFWFQSGTPTFLVEELAKEYRQEERNIFTPESYEISEDSLGIFEIGATPLPVLMFQTGYLTITAYDREKNLYKVGYPNFEVKTAFAKHLLGVFTHLDIISSEQLSSNLAYHLTKKDIPKIVSILKQLFVRVPYQLHMKEEKFYHALLQIAFSAAGINAQSEYSISHGRIDLVLDLSSLIYVIEVKFNESPQKALEQIEDRKYYEALLCHGKAIQLLGLSFNRAPKSFEITYAIKEIVST